MALPQGFLQELHDRNDIVEVIGSYVSLKRRGRLNTGLCPFHNEKTPSFVVYSDTQSYFCFGCGAGGDVITFIKTKENL
ncbi:MAG: CHC2 zinc finger domain-containing protein, partial [Oscillospiraceae bacterium]